MLLVPASAHAVANDARIFNREHADLFPLLQTQNFSADGKTFRYSGTAVGPKDDPVFRGCSAAEVKEHTLRQGAFDGQILEDNRISAGDGIHEGVWEPKGSVNAGKHPMERRQ
jgi:hypothetical protein